MMGHHRRWLPRNCLPLRRLRDVAGSTKAAGDTNAHRPASGTDRGAAGCRGTSCHSIADSHGHPAYGHRVARSAAGHTDRQRGGFARHDFRNPNRAADL